MNVLGDLLRIKVFREKKAERALTVARQRLRSAEQELNAARLSLKEHQQESARRERELYADLCKRLVLLRDIDSVHIDVQLMKEREAELLEEVDQTKARRDEMAAQEEDARAQHAMAVRMREKFDELLLHEKEEKDFEAMRLEELEIEESAEVRFARSMTEHQIERKLTGVKNDAEAQSN